jgi:hypothetical protein
MTEICFDTKAQRYRLMAADQDDIGWRRFMEGMVCRRTRDIQDTYSSVEGSNISPCRWAQGLVIKLLETTPLPMAIPVCTNPRQGLGHSHHSS